MLMTSQSFPIIPIKPLKMILLMIVKITHSQAPHQALHQVPHQAPQVGPQAGHHLHTIISHHIPPHGHTNTIMIPVMMILIMFHQILQLPILITIMNKN